MSFTWLLPLQMQLVAMRTRLPQALLLRGPEGVGQFELGMGFAQSLLCERRHQNGQACGRCAACGWFAQANHPDFRLLQPENMALEEEGEATESKKKSDQIRIEQVRDLQRFLAVGTHRAGMRVIVLHPADAMNLSTQNAVLKSLEEPPPQTLFILVTSFAHRLLPTVRSRCQSVAVPLPERGQAAKWLQEQGVEDSAALLALAGGAPILAARLAENEPVRRRLLACLRDPLFDPVAAADPCLKADPAEVVGWLQRWVYDLLSSRLAGRVRYHLADDKAISAIASRCDPVCAAAFLRNLAQARGIAQHPLNPRLFFEGLLIEYHGLIGAGGNR